jgi:hypothetical protein
MKKQYSVLSLMFALTLSFFLTSCGAKKDEALVTEFNAKKTEADKVIAMTDADRKIMSSDHTAWTTLLDSASKKMKNADTAKINGFKAEMKKHEDMAKTEAQMISDSIKAAENAKTDNNDQLKAAIAGLDAQMNTCNTGWKNIMDAHKKLGADIMAFTGGSAAAVEPSTPAAESKDKGGNGKKGTTATTPTTTTPGNGSKMDESKHEVKPPTRPIRKGSGSTIKQ